MTEYYSPIELSKMLKIHYRKVLELIAFGKLEAYKIGGSYRISDYSLNKYLMSVKVKPYWKK